jgi:hypothetical protein
MAQPESEPPRYIDQRTFFCSNMFYKFKKCDGVITLQAPKKARVFSKPQHKMTRNEFYKWTSKFKYR